MSEAKLSWGVALKGHSHDIEYWLDAFPIGFDPHAVSRNEEIALWDSDLEAARNAREAYDIASLLLGRLNGLMRVLHSAEPLEISAILEVVEDGSEKRSVFIFPETGRYRFKGSSFPGGVVIGGATTDTSDPEPTRAQKWAQVAQENHLLADALTYAAERENWFNLYKAFECVSDFVKGEHKLIALGWTTKPEKNRFTNTADALHRHRRGGKTPPANPMSIGEAQDYVQKLINSAVQGAIGKP